MKKVLMPISERDYHSTGGRFFYLLKSLSDKFNVEVLTISSEVYEDINSRAAELKNLSVKIIEHKSLGLTLDFRGNLVKVFVNHTFDLMIPGTDLKLWKTAAFDDFWGHISTCSYPELSDIDADIVAMPLMCIDDPPGENVDVLYTSILFRAREQGIKVAGYQLYPVFNVLKLEAFAMDAIIVKEEYEKQFYMKMGLRPESILIMADKRDSYSISTIMDINKDHIYNSQIPISRKELAIVLCNHNKMRPQVRDIIKSIMDAGVPVVLLLLKRGFAIKELIEDDIAREFYYDDIRRIPNCRFYLVEPSSMVPVLMVSDVVISPTFIIPAEFAARYGNASFVYNPFYNGMDGSNLNGVIFTNKLKDLSAHLAKAYEEKQMRHGMSDILSSLVSGRDEEA